MNNDKSHPEAEKSIPEIEEKARWIRRKVLDMGVRAGAAHLAPSFSCTDILAVLYCGEVLRFDPLRPDWEERDRFILSKGQAAIALYAVLAELGFFPVAELDTFTRAGSRLGGHAEDNIPGVEAFTGSLGHGLSLAAGMALGAKMDKRDYLSVALLGDGECQEGSIWEAAMFAAHHKLSSLTAIIDHNGLSAIDFIENYIRLDSLEEKWRAFGWEVKTVDGHSCRDMLEVFGGIRGRVSDKPLAVIARTVKGKGVSFMESNPIWHYRIPQGDEVERARRELSGNSRV